jgi:hypothetical protein
MEEKDFEHFIQLLDFLEAVLIHTLGSLSRKAAPSEAELRAEINLVETQLTLQMFGKVKQTLTAHNAGVTDVLPAWYYRDSRLRRLEEIGNRIGVPVSRDTLLEVYNPPTYQYPASSDGSQRDLLREYLREHRVEAEQRLDQFRIDQAQIVVPVPTAGQVQPGNNIPKPGGTDLLPSVRVLLHQPVTVAILAG